MRANLHLHSRFSDGTLWPADIVREARHLGLEALALTDHDTLGGAPDFLAAAAKAKIKAYLGCEIDCCAPKIGYKSEILAYFPSGRAVATEAFLREVTKRRSERLKAFLEVARNLFRRSDIGYEDLLARKLDGGTGVDIAALSLNKVDFYSYLKEKGIIDRGANYREFKRAYFETGLIPDSKYHRTTIEEAAAPVLADGGFLVLPHVGHQFEDNPARMKRELPELKRLLGYFRDLGVSGVELYHYRDGRTDAINELVRKAAKPFGFFHTYGSDCHGPGSEKHTLGEFEGDFAGFPVTNPT